jgi:hypothetical protein
MGIIRLQAQPAADYPLIFGKHYTNALAFIRQNAWMRDSLRVNGVDADVALSVIFPELVRFSEFRNMAETRGLEVLYTQYGKEFANFSIGNFQMKPSFIESLEKEWNTQFKNADFQKTHIPVFDRKNTYKNRSARIGRMNNIYWQIRYLTVFMLFMDKKYGKAFADKTEKCRFYAMAYNTGYKLKFREIMLKGNGEFFYTGFIKPARCYRYSDISVFYFLQPVK